MYKKDAFKKLDAKYNTHLYTGFLGYAMRYSHRQLEKFNRKKKYSKILEIGAVRASIWLGQHNRGLFSMQDVLEL